MADGRVVAHATGDTASGAFTCVVRRAELSRRLRYSLYFRNDSDGRADIVMLRGDDVLQTIAVPARAEFDAAYSVPAASTPAQVSIDVTCDGTTMRIAEHLEPAAADAGGRRRRIVLSIAAAATAGAVAASIALGVWLLLRRRRRSGQRAREAPVEPTSEPIADAVSEPFAAPAHIPAGDTIDILEPEPVWTTGPDSRTVTYDARPAGRRSVALTLVPVIVAAALLVAGFVVAHPHVGDLAAPNAVLRGSAIDIPYTSSGIGTLRYRVSSASGVDVVGGDLDRRSGTLHIPIPDGARDETYDLALMLTGPLGDARNDATIHAVALPRARIVTRVPAMPTIRSFAVTRNGGKPASVTAFYDVTADGGNVRLVDSRGIQYGAASVNAGGQARFAIPNGVDPNTLAVELHVVRGGTGADTRIALPAGQDGVAVASRRGPSGRSIGAEPVPIVVAARAVGADPIRVRILHHYKGLHLALIDGNAREITSADVPANSPVMTLAHRPVTVATRFTVQATYRVNNESDMVIRPVILEPPAGG